MDIVYIWCDPSDARWAAEKHDYWLREKGASNAFANAPGRFDDHDELRYSLRSVAQFAPFIERIFIVTDGQRPQWLAESSKVTIIDLKTLQGPEDVRPVFSSHPIETYIHRIEGLSDPFLYANDDMMFARPVTKRDFVTDDGLMIIRVGTAIQRPRSSDAEAHHFATYNAGLAIMERLVEADDDGDDAVLPVQSVSHQIDVHSREMCIEAEKMFAREYEVTRRHRFRSNDDYFVRPLWNYLAVAHGLGELRCVDPEGLFVTPNVPPEFLVDARGLLLHAPESMRPKLVCFNTDHRPVSNEWRAFLAEVLAEMYPSRAAWERA
jgi:hypothetical protein